MQTQKLIRALVKEEPQSQAAPLLRERSDLEIAALFLDCIPSAMQELRVEMRKARHTDLTVPQFRVLAQLWTEPTNNRMLAELLGLSVAATSRMVDWLIKRGLAEKAQHTSDRRQVVVQLTPLGKRSFEINQKQARLGFEKRIKYLSPSTKQNFARGLVALQKALKEMSLVDVSLHRP